MQFNVKVKILKQLKKQTLLNNRELLEEIRKTASKHANPKDPAFEDWQFVHAIAYDLMQALEEE